ncbi:MAG: hypothetical protein CYPHOPRED_002019 [Cyphobasidiales sp. Tagirdzhanova-0007]|nr:MAG: hypothetical protein CYPHOPRED_002019 [Cyphobasidiales sp. Tagirdzhanova-0007]
MAVAAPSKRDIIEKQSEAMRLHIERQSISKRQMMPSNSTAGTIPMNVTFANPKASAFFVDGTTIPEVDFDAGPSWAGLMPISADINETRQLFFWYFPPNSTDPRASDDLVFWTNGGPGCSSLEGFLQENGPISWGWGQYSPSYNEMSWTNLAHVLWVEQPVGTGFSQGVPNITNDDELAEQLVGFFNQFLDVFAELKGKNLYLTGESYAGYYVPYIANYIYDNNNSLPLNLQGIMIFDPSTSTDLVQTEIPAVPFVDNWAPLFNLNSTFTASIHEQAQTCGYTNYMDEYLKYPPAGPLPLPNGTVDGSGACDLWDSIFAAALLPNPAFNVYRIFDVPPILFDPLGFPGSFPNVQLSPLYFARADVQSAIHAPNISWEECASIDVYVNGTDNSLPSGLSILPNVIERNNRTVIAHGLADYVLIANGTRLMIQNLTWNGMQGFQTPIETENLILPGMGSMGNMHTERGLLYAEVALSGHMIPQFVPIAAYQLLSYLLGRIDSPAVAMA